MGSIRIYRIILLRNPAVFVISGSWNESVVRSRRPSQQLGFRIYVDHYTQDAMWRQHRNASSQWYAG